MNKLFQELSNRNVIRVALMYLSAAWLLAQLVTTLDDLVDLPDWVGPVFLIVLGIGFVVVLALSWQFDLTGAGVRSEEEIRGDPSLRRLPSRYLDFAIIALLAIALGYFIWESRYSPPTADADVLNVAVLPVRDISAGQDQAWFANGLTEELTRALIAVPELRIFGRTTTGHFDSSTEGPREFGKRIGATHVIDSSINTDGARLRVSAALVRVSDGITVWSDAFDDDLSDLLQIQASIAKNVTHGLEIHLQRGAAAVPPAASASGDNFEAYQSYLRGRYHLARRTPEDLDAATRYFSESLRIDSSQSRVHSSLAAVYAFSQFYTSSVDPVRYAVLAQRHAHEAIALDERNAEAHAVLGTAYLLFERNLDGARKELGRAYEISPGDADILNAYGDYFYYIGDFASSLTYEGLAAERDPLSATNQLELGLVLGFLGDHQQAIRQAELATELNPRLANGYWQRFRLRLLSGDIEAARSILETCRSEMGPAFAAQAEIRLATIDGNPDIAVTVARDFEARSPGNNAPSTLALLFALAGDDDKAAAYVRAAVEAADGILNSPMYFFLPEEWQHLPATRDALDRPELQELYRLRRANRGL